LYTFNNVYIIFNPHIFLPQSLLSTSALGLGGKYFLLYELDGSGLQWENILTSPREGDTFSLGFALLMMVLDTVVYFGLAWYIDNVLPGIG